MAPVVLSGMLGLQRLINLKCVDPRNFFFTYCPSTLALQSPLLLAHRIFYTQNSVNVKKNSSANSTYHSECCI